jgi:penicillin-binding protein 2
VSARLILKETGTESRLIKNRIYVFAWVMGMLLAVFVLRLAKIQLIDHKHYVALSKENSVKILPIPPQRGLIYSREGKLLAENRSSFSLEVVPEIAGDLDRVIQALRSIITITDEDLERFSKLKERKRRFERVSLRLNLTEDEIAKFSVNRHRFPGIDIETRWSRHYPLGEQLAHVVGYVGRIDVEELKTIEASNYTATTHIGKTGIEKAYEKELHGRAGYQQVEVNAQGRILRVLKQVAATPGKDLYLTLDLSLQAAATESLGEWRGAIVAMEPSTGAVLASVSTPFYDPNPFVNGIDWKSFMALRDSPDRPLFNRALQGKYPPGSTVKPFLGLAALEYGLRSSEKRAWCPGWFRLPRDPHKYRCWRRGGHGRVNLREAIAMSCDVYFYGLAGDLGIDRIDAYLGLYGFGRPTGIDLPGESAGLLPSRAWKRKVHHVHWFPGETLIAGIVKGTKLAKPLQLASATAMLGNHGRPVRPRVVGHIKDPAEQVVRNNMTRLEANTLLPSSKHWEDISRAMVEVMHGKSGTAREAGLGARYRIAGKTGTSQVFGIKQDQTVDNKKLKEHLRDHALFIAYAPAKDPKIALAVVVENGESGGKTAAPIARRLLDHYLLRRKPAAGGAHVR